MTHPNSLDLEAFACGDRTAALLAHVADCTACSSFVEQIRDLATGGPTADEAMAAATRAMRVNETGGSASNPRLAERRDVPTQEGHPGEEEAVESTRPAARQQAPRPAREDRTRRLFRIATGVVTPLAMAAAVFILVRRGPQVETTTTERPTSTTSATSLPPSAAATTAPPTRDPDTTFKGSMQIAVVRDRAGHQARFSSPVPVRSGDRLRVEVALDREQAILGAVLGDDGSYLEVMPLAVRGAGTHLSEIAAKIDGSPTYGTIVIGSPEAVARARATKKLEGLATQRVEWETKP